jgi:hypothetical protein
MHAPRIVAALVAAFMTATGVQLLFWRVRPPPGWHPAWWQSDIWAHIGMLLFLPASLAGALASSMLGDPSVGTRRAFAAIACGLYVVLAYFITWFVVRWIVRQFSGAATRKT